VTSVGAPGRPDPCGLVTSESQSARSHEDDLEGGHRWFENLSDSCQITLTDGDQRRRGHAQQAACFLGSDHHRSSETTLQEKCASWGSPVRARHAPTRKSRKRGPSIFAAGIRTTHRRSGPRHFTGRRRPGLEPHLTTPDTPSRRLQEPSRTYASSYRAHARARETDVGTPTPRRADHWCGPFRAGGHSPSAPSVLSGRRGSCRLRRSSAPELEKREGGAPARLVLNF
jgi:hypothetical protein